MPEIEIGDLNTVGLIRDQEGNWLPPEALTFAMNMRSVPDGMERIGGQLSVFGTPPVPPHFAMVVQSSTNVFWLYTSLNKAYVWNGSTHSDITRLLGDYTASETRQWNGTLLGGVPILNDGQDDPQYWSALNPATKLAILPNWLPNTKCAVMRSFGPYLIALNTLEGGVNFPHTLIWSHPADPGTVPASWDFTDPTRDAGRSQLPDVGAGVIMDGLPLRGHFYIYKEGSTWRMTQVGGQFVFNFDTFLETSGILGPRCVCLTGDGQNHVVATQDDIIVHNGNTANSILTNRYKKYLANAIDTNNFRNSFIFANPFRDEVIFCYPEAGFLNPNRALIWNYKNGEKRTLITETRQSDRLNRRRQRLGRTEAAFGRISTELGRRFPAAASCFAARMLRSSMRMTTPPRFRTMAFHSPERSRARTSPFLAGSGMVIGLWISRRGSYSVGSGFGRWEGRLLFAWDSRNK
jgi:hypothetical protein